MGHIHAENMAAYAEDARETDKPWERWQYRFNHDDGWYAVHHPGPQWSRSTQYRRKPRTITINGREVPEPMREAPDILSVYYTVVISDEDAVTCSSWRNDDYDKRWLSRGLCHSTKEAAIAHAEALLSFTEAK